MYIKCILNVYDKDIGASDESDFGSWSCEDGHCWPGSLLDQIDEIHSVKNSECKNVFQLPASAEEFPDLINSLKDRIRELAIDDDQTGPQDRYSLYEGDSLDERQRQCKKYMTKVRTQGRAKEQNE